MRGFRLHLILVLLSFHMLQAQSPFQLAPPLLSAPTVFFRDSVKVSMVFAHPGASIHYSFEHDLPTQDDPVYTGPLTVTAASATVYARSFALGYRPSDAVSITLLKEGLGIASIDATQPNPKYPGSGPATLYDDTGGELSLGSSAWMGYDTDSITLVLNLNEAHRVKRVMLHFLQSEDSWVFLPARVVVYALDGHRRSELGRAENSAAPYHPGSRCVPQFIELNTAAPVTKLQITIDVIKQLPEWHSGKGQHAWVFMDEIKIY